LTFYDKDTLQKIIPPTITSVFAVLEVDPLHFEVMLVDITENPPLKLYVDVTPLHFEQVMQWKPGLTIRATLRSEIFTIEEKVAEMGWSKEVCEKVLHETGYSWGNALVTYYFEGKIEELRKAKQGNTTRQRQRRPKKR
jgi:hypothetical protein